MNSSSKLFAVVIRIEADIQSINERLSRATAAKLPKGASNELEQIKSQLSTMGRDVDYMRELLQATP